MAFELAASRLLAPSIGSSMYVWTSVIGVIIAALSLGYWAGGNIADRRVRPTDIAWLLLLAAACIATTLVTGEDFLAFITRLALDPRLQGVAASVVLFLPASFVLGAISPYLARLSNQSLATTGRAVACLGTFNAIGGIIGTFLVGFVLFGLAGTAQALFVILALLVCASWLVKPRHQAVTRSATSLALLAGAAVSLASIPATPGVTTITTPTASYQAVESAYKGQPVRLLVNGIGNAQSAAFTNGNDELVFAYTRQIATIVRQAPARDTILILGGGAFTLPDYLANQYPESTIDVVEIDPQLPAIARKYFGYRGTPNIHISTQDARSYLNTNVRKYDIIIVDVYNETAIPFALTTAQYVQRLRGSLQPSGMVLANIIGSTSPACAPLLGSLHSTYRSGFVHYRVAPQQDIGLRSFQNSIFAYANYPLTGLDGLNEQQFTLSGMMLTDNYAPVERLAGQCGPVLHN